MTCDYQKTGTNAGYNVIVPAGCLGDTQINLQCKAPSESVYYHFSLVNRLQLSETIMSVIAEPSDGTEVIVDNITISNRNFKCRISGGNLNTYAGIRFLVTTNTNSVREFDVTLPVLPAGVIKDGETGKSYVIGDKGGKGDDGITPSIKAGTTTTLDAGEQASVSATTKGTETTFDFFIPQGHQGETGAKGIDGIDGIDGKDGTQVLTSNVDPLAKDASENLLWLNIVTGDLFETSPVGNGQYSWNKLGNLKGKAGSMIYTGTVDPVYNSIYKNSDLYFNIKNYNLFSFSDAQWILIGNLKGEQGARGSLWYFGTEDPIASSHYKELDSYLNTKSYNLFVYNGNAWQKTGNIKGEQGVQGIQGLQGEQGLAGKDGAQGEQGVAGKDGATWYNAPANPTSSIHYKEFDSFLNTETYDLFIYNGSNWQHTGNLKGEQGVQGISGVQGEQGIAGKDGAQGEQGLAGKDGATWYNAPSDPTPSTHYKEFDNFLNTETYDLFVYNGSNWQNKGNIKGEQGVQGPQGIPGETGPIGPQGEQGLAGKDGATWYYAPSDPTSSIHYKEFDHFLNTETYDLFVYNGSNWQNKGNIKGEQGVQGPQGIPGETGPVGPQGEQGLSGIDGKDGSRIITSGSDPDPSTAISNPYNIWLNTKTWDMWRTIPNNTGHEWIKIGNVQGLQGEQGIQGEVGQDGKDGKDGVTPTIVAGNTSTLNPGEAANVVATTTGTTTSFAFSIPQGPKGDAGSRWYSGMKKPDDTVGTSDKRGLPRAGDMYLYLDAEDHEAETYIFTEDKTWAGPLATVAGPPGKDAIQPTFTVGNVQTLPSDNDASVKMQTDVTTAQTTIYYGIPKGEKGEKGEKGDTGEQGTQGVAGDKGEKGDTGEQGPQGVAGAKGEKGDTGEQGPQGVAGAKGEKGDTGEQGPQGVAGDKGDKGDTGDQGPQGVIGAKGEKGDTGEQGTQGVAGAKGEKGETGIAGLDGKDGVSWVLTDQDLTGVETDKANFALNKETSEIFSTVADGDKFKYQSEGFLQSDTDVKVITDATSSDFFMKTAGYKNVDVRMKEESLSDGLLIVIDDDACPDKIKISVTSEDFTIDSNKKKGINVNFFYLSNKDNTVVMNIKLGEALVSLFYGDVLYLTKIMTVGLPIYQALLVRKDQVLYDYNILFQNTGKQDLNAKTLSSDKGLIKSDGQGNLIADTLKTTDYETINTSTWSDNEKGIQAYDTKSNQPVWWSGQQWQSIEVNNQEPVEVLPFLPDDLTSVKEGQLYRNSYSQLVEIKNINDVITPVEITNQYVDMKNPVSHVNTGALRFNVLSDGRRVLQYYTGNSWNTLFTDNNTMNTNAFFQDLRLYWLDFFDSYNCRLSFANMLNSYTAAEMNGGVRFKYFERSWSDEEIQQYEYAAIDANTSLSAEEKEKRKESAKNHRVSKGIYPNYSVLQFFNPHAMKATNVNNFYFDGSLVTTGALNLGKQYDLNKLQIQNNGAIALNENNVPVMYDAINNKWRQIIVDNVSNSLTTKSSLITNIAYADIYVLKSNSAFIRYPIYRKTGEPDVNLDFQYVASSYTFYFTDRLESKKTITYNFDGNVQGFTFKSKYVEDIKDTSQITLGCQSYSKTHKKPVWWDGAQWADAMGNIIT